MYVTKDYFQSDPWDAIISIINAEYFLELQPWSTQLVSLTSLGGTLTQLVIDTNISKDDQNTMPVPTTDTYTYNRLDLSEFFRQSGTVVLSGFKLPVTTRDIKAYLETVNQMVISDFDFEGVVFNNYNTVYQLNASPTSLRFTGGLSISFSNTLQQDIASLGTVVELPEVSPWGDTATGDTIAAKYYVSMYDFTKYREHLVSLTPNTLYPNGPKLAAQMNAVSGKPWTCAGNQTAHNLCYSLFNGVPKIKVVYNGRVLPRYTPRKDKLHVLVLQLSTDYCPDVTGQLLLHYD